MSSGVYRVTKDVFNILFISFLLLSFTKMIQSYEINETAQQEMNISEDLEIFPKAFIFKLTFTGILATLWCNRTVIKLGIF